MENQLRIYDDHFESGESETMSGIIILNMLKDEFKKSISHVANFQYLNGLD